MNLELTLKLEVPLADTYDPTLAEAVGKRLKQALIHPLVDAARAAVTNEGFAVSRVQVCDTTASFLWPNPEAFSATDAVNDPQVIECDRCGGGGLDKQHQWPDGSFASCEACAGYGSTQVKANS